MKSRQIQESDVDDILNIYSSIEKKTPASNLEGWSLSEIRQQFLYWIRREEYISILSECEDEVLAFSFCRMASDKLATVEVLCRSEKYCAICEEHNIDDDISINNFCNTDSNMSISSAPGVYLMDELIRILNERGVTTVNCYVNKQHHDYRVFTRLLEYGGMKKAGEFVEYELDINED